jgi:Na+/H+ antiporter NhaD/arsenite permease-like protein
MIKNNLVLYSGILISALTIIGVAFGSYPRMRMNRATISLIGATVLILTEAISLNDAYSAIDLNTLVLIFSMMILNVNLRICGFFNIISAKIISLAKTPNQLLLVIVFSSGILSGLFLNDTIVLMFTPLIIEIVITLKRNPIPYLIALATSANVGSSATIVGNPQNMLIGVFSGISFVDFASVLIPVSSAGLIVIWMIVKIFYKTEFNNEKFERIISVKPFIYKPLLIKSTISLTLMLIGFLIGIPIPVAALSAASLLLFTRRIKPERVFREIDWSLLVFFASLFVVTTTVNNLLFHDKVFVMNKNLGLSEITNLAIVSTVLSNIISNVPAVLLLKPIISNLSNNQTAWLVVAMATTFAGNLTLLGSVANMIVAESASKSGIKLKFIEYMKTGIPITLITIFIGIIWFAILM